MYYYNYPANIDVSYQFLHHHKIESYLTVQKILKDIPDHLILYESPIKGYLNRSHFLPMVSFCTSGSYKTRIDYIPSIEIVDSKYAILRDIYVSKSCSFGLPGYQIMTPGCYPQVLPLHQQTKLYPNGPVVGHYDHIIAVGNKHCDTYGHLFDDMAAPLLLIPEEVRLHYHIIIPGTDDAAVQLLEALGFDRQQMVFLRNNDWVFAHHVHTIYSSMSHFAHFSYIFLDLSRILCKYYGLPSVKPDKYALYNRKPPLKRCISNFEEITSLIRRTYSQYQWDVLETQYPTIREAAHAWYRIRIIFCVAGSHLQHTLFMSPGSGICTFMGNWGDYPVLAAAQTIGIWLRIFFTPFHHYSTLQFRVDPNLSIKELGITIHAVENGKWPFDHIDHSLINFYPPATYDY